MAPRRPNFNRTLRSLIRDIAARMPEFNHVKVGRILVVAGEARRASRGTVKPLCFKGGKSIDKAGRRKPEVRIRGRRILYCITLRPLFFRGSTAKSRLETLMHELFHISLRFDGTLHAGRRHAKLGAEFGRRLRPLVRRYLKLCPEALLADLAHSGEVRVLQWLERPGPAYHPRASHRRVRKVYTEDQLYSGVARMVTPRPRVAREAHVRDDKVH
ncbi:hypothetical protein JYJ95_23790 [Corallococcus exiguus]|uniref:hypothetical protein n=1 Tax=Corallococcus exiguus TaxID=83462 RepID=UPI001A8FE5FD|nr:hypothetical protein [Corallococcus exiguus]